MKRKRKVKKGKDRKLYGINVAMKYCKVNLAKAHRIPRVSARGV